MLSYKYAIFVQESSASVEKHESCVTLTDADLNLNDGIFLRIKINIIFQSENKQTAILRELLS